MVQEFSFGHVRFSLDIQAKMITCIRSSSGEKSEAGGINLEEASCKMFYCI